LGTGNKPAGEFLSDGGALSDGTQSGALR
jgi:hypothetical protein